ncbi:MAG: glycosyltransferase [bacterium]
MNLDGSRVPRVAGTHDPRCGPSEAGTIEIAVVSDPTYIEPIGVMLHSILRWHDPGSLRIHWVHVRMDRQALRAAEELCRAAALRVNLVRADAHLAESGWPADVNPTLLKVLLPEILADAGERLLYLDGDLVVEGPLWPLWQIDLQAGALAGVRDSWVGARDFWSTIPPSIEVLHDLWMRRNYINAGVVLFDMARCRSLDMSGKCTRWLMANRRSYFFEQDALNVAVADAIVLAPPAWNVFGGADTCTAEAQPPSAYSAAEILAAYRNPMIVHFAGWRKPWGDAKHWPPLARRYFRARRCSPWHRPMNVAQHLHLAALELAHWARRRRQVRAASAIYYAGRAVLEVDERLTKLLAAKRAR